MCLDVMGSIYGGTYSNKKKDCSAEWIDIILVKQLRTRWSTSDIITAEMHQNQ